MCVQGPGVADSFERREEGDWVEIDLEMGLKK